MVQIHQHETHTANDMIAEKRMGGVAEVMIMIAYVGNSPPVYGENDVLLA